MKKMTDIMALIILSTNLGLKHFEKLINALQPCNSYIQAQRSAVLLPGYKEVEHSQRHEGDTDVEGNSHCSILLKDFLKLLGLVGFPSLWLSLPWGLFRR